MTIDKEDNNLEINENEDVFIFPTSYGQKRMWFLDQFEPGSPYYNIPVAFKIKGKFDSNLFVKTINKIIDRHESLRTNFANIKGQPFQIISPHLKIEIPIIDISDNNNITDELKKLATKEARAPFNLAKGPLFRVKILHLSENENVVLITMHHIISDGWSMGILVGELTSIYSALISGEQINLYDISIQYADFSEWQNGYLAGDILDKQLNYWKNKLGNSNSLLELPLDRNRKPIYTNNGSSIERVVSNEIIIELQKISNSENASLFMSLITAFNILLSRYSGQSDINIGTPIANRNNKELEKIIGLFINTLVIRTDLKGDPTFKELLRKVRKNNLEAFEHQDLPFEMLVDAIQPERNMSYAPLFQVMIILQNNPISTTELSGIEIEMIDVDMGTSTSDITYSISIGKSGASCSIEYNTDLFNEDTMHRMFDDFNYLLYEIIKDPEKKISQYKILSPKSDKLIQFSCNSRKIDYPNVNGIHSLFERWVEQNPEAIAVVDDFAKISYNELNERANQLAYYLIEKNINKNLPVGISQNKSINLLVSVLGILKAGFAYLPLDPTYPKDRLDFMISDSGIETLITDRINSEIFSDIKNLIVIDGILELKKYPKKNLELTTESNELAYIIYTSGSTGQAKGTMIQHESLINIYLGWEKDYRLLSDARNHLQMASFSFDVFGGDWTRALCSGGKLVLVNREKLLDAKELYNIITKENIQIAEFVPAVLRNLINYLNENSLKLNTFRILIAGSDLWYIKEYKEFLKFIPKKTRLINSFGLTETAIDSTFFEGQAFNLPDDHLVPIGKSFPNIQIYILDVNLNILPIGVKGELYIGGVSLARGYLKRPDNTAEKFIPNPFSQNFGDRLYRTGDIARFLPDGNIEFLGRVDTQIKLRGFRIELGEIENAISKFKGIKQSVVLVKIDKTGDKKLIAYILNKKDEQIEINELRKFISEKVPEYMIPSAFILMDKFPLTPNGKIDRKAFPEATQNDIQNVIELDFIPPSTDTEKILCKIWEEILTIENVGINHNFFILGGHSLLATQVISRIKVELKVDLPLRFIFEKPTIYDIGLEVDRLKLLSSELTDIKIEKRKNNLNIPLSFAQERLWFLDQLQPNSPFYNIPESYRIKGNINLEILEKCFNKIIERHEILRTYFISIEGTPIQVIEDSYKIQFPITDLSNEQEHVKEKKLIDLIKEESESPISINELPLFKIKIVKLDNDDYAFLMTIHHIISDEWSSRVIVNELVLLYESIVKNIDSPLDNLQIQYADYSVWQREWLKGDVLDSQINYWKTQLDGIPSLLELPLDKARPRAQTFNGDYTSFAFTKDVAKKINEVSKLQNVTSFTILLAVFNIFLYKLSGQQDIVIGTPNASRNKKEIEPLIGFFVNTLAIRTNCSGNPSFKEFLQKVRETTLGAYSNQDLPFEYIVDFTNPERDLSHSPIFQVMFVYQKIKGIDNNTNEDLIITPIETHSKTSKFDLTLFLLDAEDETSGAFEYNTDLFNKTSIDNFIKQFNKILNEAVSNINIPIERLSLLRNEFQERIVENLNNTEILPSIKEFINEKISFVANSNLDKVAIELLENKLTFAELEKHSNQLANHLLRNEVKTENIIAVCLPRSIDLIISVFGILKSGAAYLPIDPSYPEDRIEYLIEDSNTQYVITNKNYFNLFSRRVKKVLVVDDLKNELELENENFPIINIEKNNICYVIYTSGSTGKPKGTLITHEGLLNYLSWASHSYPFKQENGSLVHSTLSFDATITSIIPPLFNAKKIVLMKESDEIEELANTIKANDKFSTLKITPAHLELLSNLINAEKAKNVADAFVIGGENLTSKQIKYWQKHAPDTLLFNEYGPTESVVGCVVYESSKFKNEGSIPIGKVIPNMKVFVLDKNLAQVPKGVVGELYLGGVSLARGYINKTALTAEKFIPNPFAKNNGERIYKTGDLVKMNEEGNLIFIGRIDDQVKIRGYRIELGEIEAKLKRFTDIKECVVDVKDYGEDDKRLFAYVVTDNKELDINEISQNLRRELPGYMIPSQIIIIEKIPLTINGKVDRKKLPVSESQTLNRKAEFVKPSTNTEIKLAEIWSYILKLNKISVYDNFFDLGGHSLLVTKLVVRINNSFKIVVPLKDIFEFPTIAELAKQIDDNNYIEEKITLLPPLKKYIDKTEIPLSFTQKRLWFLDQLDKNQSIYNMPMAVKVYGTLNIEVVKKTIDYLAKRHESLRTNIKEINNIPQQVIYNEHKIKVEFIDLQKSDETKLNNKINELRSNEADKPFNLSEDSLLRIKVAQTSYDEFILFFTMHHIISDGWSINILVDEFTNVYLSLIKNVNPVLPELSIQYSDYSIWQQENITDKVLQKQIEYWKQKLEDVPSQLNLPFDKKRPLSKTFNGSHISFEIPKNFVTSIKSKVREFQLTPFMFLGGTFQLLLSKLSGQNDICIGTPIANRTNFETERIIGFFANTLVLRNNVDGFKTISRYFEKVKETSLEAFANQDVPFEKLVELINPERDLSNTPLFQVMFVLQNDSEKKNYQSSELKIETLETENNSTQFDLTLSMNTNDEIWEGTFEFNTDLFSIETIENFIKSFKILLSELTNEKRKYICELQFLTDEQKNRILSYSKSKIQDYIDENAIQKFEKIALRFSDKIACEFNEKTITYNELNVSSDKIKIYLLRNGYKVEDKISVMIPNNIELIKWILGIMKAGCVYIPIDPMYPEERINFILNDSNTQTIVSNNDHFLGKISKIKIRKINSNVYQNIIDTKEIKTPQIYPDNLAYIIYTSGSTGKPKGVMLNHKGLLNLVENQTRDFGVNEKSEILQFASIGFDASISEIFMALSTGATLHFSERDQLTNPFDVKEILEEKNISIATFPPSLLHVLDNENLENLKTIISAGEKLNIDVFTKWNKNRKVINAFGPTESTVGVSSLCPSIINENWGSIPIGKPIYNVELFILDQYLNLVQEETTGELFISGDNLARGYLNNPLLTAEKFIPHPFGIKGERLYKTGDLVKFTKEGFIEYVGRVDYQVKVRGYRIELSEIEIVLKSIENIKDAAVITDGQGEKVKLIAFIQLNKINQFNVENIKNSLASKLPYYMIPGIFLKVDKIPLTSNGKVDRKKLLEQIKLSDFATQKYVAPSTIYETKLVEIWQELLNLEKVGVDDSFFELGGHSLLATQLVSRIKENFNIDYQLKYVFEHPAIKNQANKIEELENTGNFKNIYLQKVERPDHIPLSFAQQRLWFIDNLEPGNPFYNLPFVTRIKGDLNLLTLEKSLQFVIGRHEILRTLFKSELGKPEQVIESKGKYDFIVKNLSNNNENQKETFISNYVKDLILKPFDLQNGPLLRIHILTKREDEFIFILTMHHIISDGWSMGILFNELILKYREIQNNENIIFPELKLQYADYSYLQRSYLTGELLEKHLKFWKEKLSGIPKLLNLPLDHKRPPLQTFNGKTLQFSIDKEHSASINKIGRKLNATTFMTFLAAFKILLYRYTNQDDIVVGTPIANRNILELEKLIGFFVNTLAIRTIIQKDDSFIDIIKKVQDFTLNAYAYQDLPFEMLIDELKIERDLSHTPIFQVMFVMQNMPFNPTQLSDIVIEPVEAESNLSKFDLQITLVEHQEGIEGTVEYNCDLFEKETIQRFINSYLSILNTVNDNPYMKIGKIPILNQTEKMQMLKICNEEISAKANTNLIHKNFEENVLKYPNNIALSFNNINISYKELNKRANKLARYLIYFGVKSDDLIGLCVERSIEMIVGIIAIIKAGGAYVSLDPAYPKERLNFIAEDSNPKVILTIQKLNKIVDEMGSNIIYLDTDWEKIEQESSENLNIQIFPQNIVYIIYTSGSTGKPKGVMVTHNNLIRLFSSTNKLFDFNSNDVWTFFHSYAFDFSVWELWGALLYGGRVVIVPYLISRSPEQFYELLLKEKVTVLNQTPSAFRQLIQEDSSKEQFRKFNLRYVIFGGDKLDLHSLKSWFDKYGDKKPKLINMYGITETTVHVTYRPLDLSDLENIPGSVIGKPISDLQIYILDENLEPVPIGVPGEIYVGGLGVTRGYKNRPDLTIIQFIPNSFSKNKGERLYKTGDLARFLENGDIEYLSRKDNQVQIYGFRVELGEIENVISQHPYVTETLVLFNTDDNENKKIIAYYVAKENKEIPVEEFKRFLKSKLPDYMLPTLFVKMEVFPLTEHGKINRKLLPKPSLIRPVLEAEFLEPSTEVEITLAKVWKKLLNINKVGANDNFFDLGGDSILSIQMIALAKEENIILTPRQVFQNPTIKELSIISKDNVELENYQGIVTGEAELSPIQSWFFENHKNNPNRFNSSMFLKLSQKLTYEAINVVIKKMVEHHDSLRLRFTKKDNIWKQNFTKEIDELPIFVVDLTEIKKQNLSQRISEEVENIQNGFNITQGPLFKIVYFNFGENKNPNLLIVFHHLVLDGVSWRILINDFFSLFKQYLDNQELKLGKKTTSYKKWVDELTKLAHTYQTDFNSNYWKKLLNYNVVSQIPVDFIDGKNTYESTEDITLSLDVESTSKLLKELPNQFNLSLNDILIFNLIRVITSWNKTDKIIIELEGHGREDIIEGIDLSRTIGWFTSIFPVVFEYENGDLKTQLQAISKTISEVPNKGFDFGLLKYTSPNVNVKRIIEKIPHPQINFNYLGQFDQNGLEGSIPFTLSSYSAGIEQEPSEIKPCLLYVVAIINGGELHVRWLFSKNNYKSKTIKKLAKQYIKELKEIIYGN